ncbi:helix-turn-helix domain-containing protein [Plantactinospora sp. GCM10030261]|uniref:helix-turn-helix domain-containing protein n=1 Tax=Plantactinospora sp. GCM10030261 TaxID=3273420 RepID=UPI0036150D87
MPSALDPPPPEPMIGRYPAPGLVRRARRIAGMGQREMARFAKVAPSTIARVETGAMTPSLDVLQRILGAAGLHLAVVDEDGHVIAPMRDWDEETRDGAGRRYPSHLDTILDPRPGEWWGDIYGLQRPPETFCRPSPVLREAQRRRSVWEVRVKQNRGVPPPADMRSYYPWGNLPDEVEDQFEVDHVDEWDED